MPEVQMPRLSDTMTEGILSRWLKHEGELIAKGDVLAEIETDKATMELEAYDEGPLTAQLVAEGTTVPIGAPIAIIGEAAASAADTTETTVAPSAPESRLRASPLVRKLAHEHGIDLATLTGTGPGGRIVRADIEPLLHPHADTAAGGGSPEALPAASVPASAAVEATEDDEEVPLTAIRRTTARRLTESAAVPHFFLTSVADTDRLLTFRAEINAALADTGGKVSVTDLLVRACAVALRAHPQVNSSWGKNTIVRHRRIHLGVAVATDAGLIVPVIRDADRKSVHEIATEARSLAERAHAGTLTPPDYSGGTFTVSNLGMYAIDHFTAILNPPEAAILAVGAATPTPVVREGEVVVRATTKLTLTVDHRVVDGAPAAAFMRELKEIVEAPLRIVL